ncbi:MAG: HlyD family secretion protein [Burkholderiales bacterium]|nr:HlyD family secretion protein [Burkholderiales bacterium]
MKRAAQRALLLIVVPALALVLGLAVWLKGGRFVETDNAYVKADKVPVSAEVAGAIREVLVAENQAVRAGQPLFRLNAVPFQVAVERAQARLAQVRADVAALRASYRAKRSEIALARTKLAFALRDQQRQADLASRNFIAPAKLDEVREAAELAGQQIETLEQDLQRIAETLGGRPDMPLERQAAYLAALAELAQATLDLERTEIRAPLPGTAGKPPKPGQYLAAGAIAMTLVASDTLWVEANFPETDLTYVRAGQPAQVRVDTFPGAVWTGAVESLSPATGAEFSVLPAQNATGNWIKVTQRVPLRIRIDARPGQPPLRAGLSTTVRIDTGHERRLGDLLR